MSRSTGKPTTQRKPVVRRDGDAIVIDIDGSSRDLVVRIHAWYALAYWIRGEIGHPTRLPVRQQPAQP